IWSRWLRSSAACDSASLAIFSTSSFASPEDDVMVIFCSLLVARSLAVTLRMPLASISNVTSTCGTPRGAGGMPTSWNTPNRRLSFAMARSPWKTLISTEVWLSAAVENTSLLRVGMVVLRSISLVNTPPRVSIPSNTGIRQGLLARAHRALQNVFHHLLEARTRQLHDQVLGTSLIGRDERQIDLDLEQRRELHLGLFGGFLKALQRHLVAGKVDTL